MTVAIAAPGAPSLHTLMSIGSRIILVIAAVTSCVTIGTIILPIACNMRLSMVSIIKPKEQHMQIVRYVEPIFVHGLHVFAACDRSRVDGVRLDESVGYKVSQHQKQRAEYEGYQKSGLRRKACVLVSAFAEQPGYKRARAHRKTYRKCVYKQLHGHCVGQCQNAVGCVVHADKHAVYDVVECLNEHGKYGRAALMVSMSLPTGIVPSFDDCKFSCVVVMCYLLSK